MKLTLRVWRQQSKKANGKMVDYIADDVSPDMSFLEMIDVVNASLEAKGEEPIAFEHDCREGICGSCAMMINGHAHGPKQRTTTCQLHMRSFKDGDTIIIEPWRSSAFPVIKDLIVDRSSLDRIVQAGGYISVRTGSAPDANAIPIDKNAADQAMDAAACIGCGACVAACPNGSAMLFTAAKISHLNLLPQGEPEKFERVQSMLKKMDDELFGSCTNYGKCQDACPKGISINFIGMVNKDYIKANLTRVKQPRDSVEAQ
jgi:succinate dehydrogenase / fumarate reductase iron-sulfur subunit